MHMGSKSVLKNNNKYTKITGYKRHIVFVGVFITQYMIYGIKINLIENGVNRDNSNRFALIA